MKSIDNRWKAKIFLLSLSLSMSSGISLSHAEVLTRSSNVQSQQIYNLELSRWGIYNDGTHPTETTKGINDALKWASSQGYTVFKVPAGTYLISKGTKENDSNAHITMVSNMAFLLDDNAVIQKETNNYANYTTLEVPLFIHHVTIKGGTYQGDKRTHDFSKGGTQEGGYGIVTSGAYNVTIDGIKAENFTGDGLAIGGAHGYFKDLYASSFESGTLDNNGQPIADSSKTRTKSHYSLKDSSFQTTGNFVIDNIKGGFTWHFDVYFYNADGSFLTVAKNQAKGDYIQIPDGADNFALVLNGTATNQSYLEIQNKVQSHNVRVNDSEFAFNRRQGITVGGADNVVIENSKIHDMKGTAPQSGIDVEGGYGGGGYLNNNITVKNNDFYNNQVSDLILYDGRNATVEGNSFRSNAIGLAVSEPFSGANITNNTFDHNARIYAYNESTFDGNVMHGGLAAFLGKNDKITNMTFNDTLVNIASSVPFGIEASNIIVNNTEVTNSQFGINANPAHISNVTINGATALDSFAGNAADGSTFDNVKILGYKRIQLLRGTYTNCDFEAAPGVWGPAVQNTGNYEFDNCTFKSDAGGFSTDSAHGIADSVVVRNSTFELTGPKVGIGNHASKSFVFDNNTIIAEGLTDKNAVLFGIGNGYWHKSEPTKTGDVSIKGNTFDMNLPAIAIQSIYSGTNASGYDIEDNTIYNGVLDLKADDINQNNHLLQK